MIHRFLKITDGLYRGSAPSPKDVKWLKDNFGIKKIVSLDREAGEQIHRTTQLLGIKHIMAPIDETKKSLINFLSHDLKKLVFDDGPTFIHCLHGKDRTSLLASLIECRYLGVDPEVAIAQSKKLGFGIGVSPKVVHLYEKIIRSCKPLNDQNHNDDIVSNERSYISDNRDSYFDEHRQNSFAPILSPTRQNPYDSVYTYTTEQSPTRENYWSDWHDKKEELEELEKDEIDEGSFVPQVGIFNNEAGLDMLGPTINMTGFISD